MDKARTLRRVVIKEEYVLLTGDHASAVLLSQIEYWTVRTRDFDRFLAEEKNRSKMEGREIALPLLHGWIYKTAEDLSAETMMGLSANTIRARLRVLVERGWISERNNPDHSWDRTKQYRFNARAVATDLERLGCHLEGWAFTKEEPDAGTPHGCATANFENGTSKSEVGNATPEDRISNFENRTFENCGAIPEINTEIRDRDQQQRQQPVSDHAPAVDHGPVKDVVAVEAPTPINSAQEPGPHMPAQREIEELIDFARAQAHEIIRRAGSLAAAKEKIEVASVYITKERRAGREINSIKGVMNRILQMDTGGIKLGCSKEEAKRQRRLTEKEEKYKDLYMS